MTNLLLYRGTADEDLLVARWWCRMHEDGDLADLFTESRRTISGLFDLIRAPKNMIYAADDTGLWFGLWTEQLVGGVATGMWLRRDVRATRRGLFAFLDALERLLRVYPVILGVTKQKRLLEPHEKLGYTVMGELPEFFDGQTAWVVSLTREALQKTLIRYGRVSVELAQKIETTNGHQAQALVAV